MKLSELRGSMTQRELANQLHVSCSSLGKYERGERTPRDNVKKRIAEYFGKSVQEIFFDD